MEALEGEADKASPEQEQMGSVCSHGRSPLPGPALSPIAHLPPLSLILNFKKVQTREGQRKRPPHGSGGPLTSCRAISSSEHYTHQPCPRCRFLMAHTGTLPGPLVLVCGRDVPPLSIRCNSPGSSGLCRLGPCYLSRPSALTGPSSDLGSGDRELQLVSLQSSREGQAEGPVAHNPATDQKLLSSPSVQASSAGPVSSVRLLAASSMVSG